MRFTWVDFNRFGLAREVVITEIVDYLHSADAETEDVAEMSAEQEVTFITYQQLLQDYLAYLCSTWNHYAGSNASCKPISAAIFASGKVHPLPADRRICPG